jgi:hypothetical protein
MARWISDLQKGDDPPFAISSHHAVPGAYLTRSFIDPGDLPLRPERHIANAIATVQVV